MATSLSTNELSLLFLKTIPKYVGAWASSKALFALEATPKDQLQRGICLTSASPIVLGTYKGVKLGSLEERKILRT